MQGLASLPFVMTARTLISVGVGPTDSSCLDGLTTWLTFDLSVNVAVFDASEAVLMCFSLAAGTSYCAASTSDWGLLDAKIS